MNIEGGKVSAAALALMAAAVVFLSWWSANQRLGKPGIKTTTGGAGELKIKFPQYVLDYVGEARLIPDGIKDALPPDTTIAVRDYTATDGFGVMLMGVLMGTDRTSIHQPEFCLKGSGFRIIGSGLKDTISVVGPNSYELPVMILRTGKEHEGVMYPGFYVYWFVADGLATARHWERMWWMAKGLFATGELQRWAYVSCLALSSPGNEESCLKRVKEFLAHAVPEFQPRPESLAGEGAQKVAAVAEE